MPLSRKDICNLGVFIQWMTMIRAHNQGKMTVRQTTPGDHLKRAYYTVSQKNCAELFLSEICQISNNFENFWQKDGK